MGPSNFNLRQSVDNYVNLIQNKGALTGSDVKELTDHLLDATDELRKSGLSDEEAFMVASKRLGNDEILTQEYAKANPSINTNKIWSYLFLGYNLFYTFFTLVVVVFGGFYLFMYQNFANSLISVVVITTAHLLFTCLMIIFVGSKTAVSEFIEMQVRNNPLRTVLISFVPQVVFLILKPFFISRFPQVFNEAITYPWNQFKGTFVEFTFFLAALSIVGAFLSLVFSIRKSDSISLRSLFEKPSILFLISFGILIEILSASSRTIPTSGVLFNSMIFGIIYLGASYLISLYNPSNTLRYLLIFALFGILAEGILGFNRAIENGYTYNIVYFLTALLTGVFLGWKLANRTRNAKLIPGQS